jgi:hypothetical protein
MNEHKKKEIMQIINRIIKQKDEAVKIEKELNKEIYNFGFKMIDEGDGEIPPTYAHKDFPELEFYSEMGDIYEPVLKGTDDVINIDKHRNKHYLKALTFCLSVIREKVINNVYHQVLDKDDYEVGELIKSVNEDDDGETCWTLITKYNTYELKVPFWFKDKKEIVISKIEEQCSEEKDFWKK